MEDDARSGEGDAAVGEFAAQFADFNRPVRGDLAEGALGRIGRDEPVVRWVGISLNCTWMAASAAHR